MATGSAGSRRAHPGSRRAVGRPNDLDPAAAHFERLDVHTPGKDRPREIEPDSVGLEERQCLVCGREGGTFERNRQGPEVVVQHRGIESDAAFGKFGNDQREDPAANEREVHDERAENEERGGGARDIAQPADETRAERRVDGHAASRNRTFAGAEACGRR